MTYPDISRLAASNGHRPKGGCPSCGRDMSQEVAPADQHPDAVCGVCHIASSCPGGHTVEELRHLDSTVVHTVYACANMLTHLTEMASVASSLLEMSSNPPETKAMNDFALQHVKPCQRDVGRMLRGTEETVRKVTKSLAVVWQSNPKEAEFVLGHHEMGQAIMAAIGGVTRGRRR